MKIFAGVLAALIIFGVTSFGTVEAAEFSAVPANPFEAQELKASLRYYPPPPPRHRHHEPSRHHRYEPPHFNRHPNDFAPPPPPPRHLPPPPRHW